jgi:flagellar hook-associated protein 1 FlgK
MSNNILQIGLTGINAATYALTTTGENISNASTAGYDVQSVQTQEASGQFTGSGFLGTGVDVTGVTRAYSQYLTTQLNQAQSQSSSLSTNGTLLTQLNNILGSPTAGLTTAISGFFTGLQKLTSNSATASTRSSFIGNAQTLVNQVNNASQQFSAIGTSINTQVTSTVAQINSYASQIAQLNTEIGAATAASGNTQSPNNLLDERDQAVASLSQLVGTTVVPGAQNSISVFIGSGQSLVLGSQTFQLAAVPSTSDPSQTTIAYQPAANAPTQYLPESSLTGGSLGGLLQFRSQTLEPAETALNTLAATVAGAVNQQNELGLNQSGQQGAALFSVPGPTVIANTANTGTGVVSVAVINAAAPPADNYTLSFNGSQYTLVDQTTGNTTTFSPTATFPVSEFGLSINVAGLPKAGDSYIIKPTADAASALALTTTSPAAIAAAVPVLAAASTSNVGTATISQGTVTASYFTPVLTAAPSSNTGTGTISASTVGSSYAATPLTSPVTLNFTAPGTYTASAAVTVTSGGVATAYAAGTSIPYVAGDSLAFNGQSVTLGGAPATGDQFVIQPNAPLTGTTTLQYNASTGTLSGFPANDAVSSTVNGTTTTYAPPVTSIPYSGTAGATLSFGGLSVNLSGTPSNGDQFTINPSNGASDVRNASALAALQNADLLAGGTQTIGGAYAALVSQVGTQTQNVTVASTAQSALVTQFQTQQQSVSGVNLNEEAANLLQEQQIYQANSKVIQIASSLFDTILQIQ